VSMCVYFFKVTLTHLYNNYSIPNF
jgi:hypothetical protein